LKECRGGVGGMVGSYIRYEECRGDGGGVVGSYIR